MIVVLPACHMICLVAGPTKVSLLEAVSARWKPFTYAVDLSTQTILEAGRHRPALVREWTAFLDKAVGFVTSLKDTSARFEGYQSCSDAPLSEETCLFLCDKYHFAFANQLTAAAGMPGLEFSVPKPLLKGVKLACRYLLEAQCPAATISLTFLSHCRVCCCDQLLRTAFGSGLIRPPKRRG